MIVHLTLQKQYAFLWIKPGAKPIENHFIYISADLARVRIIRRQRVPVGDEEKALVAILELDPVGQRAHVVAKMKFSRGAHAAEYTGTKIC